MLRKVVIVWIVFALINLGFSINLIMYGNDDDYDFLENYGVIPLTVLGPVGTVLITATYK